MNTRLLLKLLLNIRSDIEIKYDYISGEDSPYHFTHLKSFRKAVLRLEEVNLFTDTVNDIKQNPVFSNDADQLNLEFSKGNALQTKSKELATKFDGVVEVIEKSETDTPENSILIQTDSISDFDSLIHFANDLKKSISVPVLDNVPDSKVTIDKLESGSIIMIIALGSPLAVGLIGQIVWSAAVIRKKKAEAKMFEEHAKTLNLKNESLETLLEAQKEALKLMLQTEAESVYGSVENEIHNEKIVRIRHSIEVISKMIDNGVKVLPTVNNPEDVQNLFPDYSKLNLIESKTKQITSGD